MFPYGWLIACSRSQISLNFLQVADSNEITRNLYDLTFDTYKDKVVQVAFRSVPMSKVKLDLRSILKKPLIYRLLKSTIASERSRRDFVRNYICPKDGDRVLDIGCGPADILDFLPAVDYIGFDANPKYIQEAMERYKDRGTFFCEVVSQVSLPIDYYAYFDIVLAIGVLHHLNDAEALDLLRLAHIALKPGGRLITLDGVFTERQSPCARWIISMDRGQHVRNQSGYTNLVRQVFENLTVSIRHDMIHVPYTHIIIECKK